MYGFFLCRLYAFLLGFYPRLFRREFTAEIQSVFEQALVEASGSGRLVAFSLRELRDLPGALLRAHLQERRLMHMPLSSGDKPIRWWGVLAGMGLFLIPMIFELGEVIPHLTIASIFRVGLIVSVLAVILLGIFKGLSRWGLPVLGLILGIFWVYGGLAILSSWLVPLSQRFVQSDRQVFRILWQVIMDGVIWGGLFLICLVFIFIFLLIPPLRHLYRRIRNDWTLVSFTLYGAILFALFIDWDEYTQEHVFVAICYLFLALGVAGYLLSKTKASRITWLLVGASLSMITMAVGKFILVPLQDWPQWFQWHSMEAERWYESLRSLIELAWILLVLLAPSVLTWLPSAKEVSAAPQQENSALSVAQR